MSKPTNTSGTSTQEHRSAAPSTRNPVEQAILDALEKSRGSPLSAAEAEFALEQARALGEI